MKKTSKSLQSPLGRVRSLGSAGNGTEHWLLLRLTSIVLVPLSIYFVASFYIHVVDGGYEDAVYWLRSPFTSTFLILFLAITFHHAANGLQVVIEDYIHCSALKLASVVVIKSVCSALALLGILAAIKVLFGV